MLQLASEKQPELILLDVMMPEIDGFEVCRRLKAGPGTARIPVIFVTARTEAESIARGFSLGAVDYLTKPYLPTEVQVRVRTHLEHQRTDLELEATIARLTEALAHVNDVLHAVPVAFTDRGVKPWSVQSFSP